MAHHLQIQFDFDKFSIIVVHKENNKIKIGITEALWKNLKRENFCKDRDGRKVKLVNIMHGLKIDFFLQIENQYT